MAYGDDRIFSIPYTPVYEEITPRNYDYFDRSGVVLELFGDKAGNVDISLLTQYLKNIIERYEAYSDRTQPRFGDPSLGEQREDAELARRILKMIKDKELKVVLTLDAFKESVGDDLYANLVVMLNLREDEQTFRELAVRPLDDGREEFPEMQGRLQKYEVAPAAVASLKSKVGAGYFERMENLFAIAAQRGTNEGKGEEAFKFAADIVTYETGGKTFAISERFKPFLNNPNHPMICVDEHMKRSGKRFEFGYFVLCGLEEFLQNDVDGTHQLTDAFLNRNNDNELIKVNLPDSLTIMEGEEIVIPNFVQTPLENFEFRYEVKYHGRYYKVYRAYDKEKNTFTISAPKNLSNHEQSREKFSFTIRPETPLGPYAPAGELRYECDVSVKNMDEPPSVQISGDEYVVEGAIFCLDVKWPTDPEGDAISFDWSETSGHGVELVTHNYGRRVCAQAPVLGAISRPLGLKLDAKSVLKTASIEPAATSVTKTVYVLPRVDVGENLQLPVEVVRAMTDPNGSEMASASLAGEEGIYIFLRLPRPLENYQYKIDADVANEVNVEGAVATISERAWGPFERVPSEDGIYAYFSRSPKEPYIKSGRYTFYDNDVQIFKKGDHSSTSVRLKGNVNIDNSAAPLQIRFGEVKRLSDSMLRVRFDMTNRDAEQAGIEIADGTPVDIGIKQGDNIRFETTVKLTRDANSFNIDVPFPKEFASSNYYGEQYIFITVDLKDSNGRKIELLYSDRFQENGGGVFERIRLSTPNYPMPPNWLGLEIDWPESHGLAEKTIPGASYSFGPLMDFSLWHRFQSYPPVEIEKGKKYFIPFFTQKRLGDPATGGGTISGEIGMRVPFKDGEKGSWWVGVKTNTYLQVVSGAVRTPRGEDMFANGKKDEKGENGEGGVGVDDCPEIKTSIGAFKKEIDEKARIEFFKGEVRPGDEFYVDLVLPVEPDRYEITDWFINKVYINVIISDKVGNEHTLGLVRHEVVDGHIMRLYFKAPTLLTGEIKSAFIGNLLAVQPSYVVKYLECKGEKYKKKINVAPFDKWTGTYSLNINFVTDKDKKIEGTGKLLKEDGK